MSMSRQRSATRTVYSGGSDTGGRQSRRPSPAGSAVEPEPETVERAEPEPTPSVTPVGRREPVARERDDAGAQRFGRERHGLRADIPTVGHLGRPAVEQVESDLRAEARRRDTESGVTRRIGDT